MVFGLRYSAVGSGSGSGLGVRVRVRGSGFGLGVSRLDLLIFGSSCLFGQEFFRRSDGQKKKLTFGVANGVATIVFFFLTKNF
jgi:hypothetical protein